MQKIADARAQLVNIVHSLGLECLGYEDEDECSVCVNFKNGISVYLVLPDEKAPVHYEVGYWSKRGGETIPEYSQFIVEEHGDNINLVVRSVLLLPLIWEVRTIVDKAVFQEKQKPTNNQQPEESTCKLKRV